MAEPRLRRAESPAQIEQVVDDYMTQGFEILSRGEHSVMLRRKTWGTVMMHGLIFLFTFWTAGVVNVAYALYAHSTAERVLVKYTPPYSAASDPANGS